MLATVPNRYVRDWLRSYLEFPDGSIAIGGNDRGDFGWEIWGWEDMRTRWSWENWKKGEPNGMTSENCLAIWPDYYNDDYYDNLDDSGCRIVVACNNDMNENEFCEADGPLPDGNSHFEINNCLGNYDIFKCTFPPSMYCSNHIFFIIV